MLAYIFGCLFPSLRIACIQAGRNRHHPAHTQRVSMRSTAVLRQTGSQVPGSTGKHLDVCFILQRHPEALTSRRFRFISMRQWNTRRPSSVSWAVTVPSSVYADYPPCRENAPIYVSRHFIV